MPETNQNIGLYRQGVGIILLNSKKKVFVAKRIDNAVEAWQMPQGGIDDGENELQAMERELEEEIGITPALTKLIYTFPEWLTYDLPQDLQKKLWQGKYLGQRQKWFVLEFLGNDSDINICTTIPEFCEWKWEDAKNLPELIVDFKKELYQTITTTLQKVI